MVPPLAAIPTIVTRREQRWRRLRLVVGWVGVILLLAGALAFVHFFVRPLDVLWITLQHRFGM
jgi:hypothetical protein